MLMRRLLEGLFEHGVVLVTTSNQHPDQLYKDGLQRSQFLPAIELIKKNLHVVNVDGGTDYRLRELERAGVYHTGPDAEARMEQAFIGIARHESTDESALEIEGRVIQARRVARGVAWFDFRELCDGPRGKADYIELARRYHTVLVSDIPEFKVDDADIVRRFTWLVDEFYDRRVKLIVSAAAPPAELYSWAEGGDQFERTISRLIEMQTRDYLSEPHLP
jgi:cell division protein ZapE